jgi:hypothetical protein
MNARLIDRLTLRTAHGLSRRNSLLALGAAGLAGVFAGAQLEPAQAKHKKNPCKKQTDQCVSVLTGVCAGNAQRLTEAQACCPIIGQCNFKGFLDCLAA